MWSTPDEIREAVTCVVDGGWGTQRQLHSAFTFYSTYPRSFPFVAMHDGAIVGTAAGTHYERSGWIAHVFVAPSLRGRGLGRRLTATVIERLRNSGCETILLAATDLGRPVYESLGFQVESAYHEMRGPALPLKTPMHPLRPLLPSDQSSLEALDRRVSGDHRDPRLALVSGYGWCLERRGEIAGAVLPTPWGAAAASLVPEASVEEAAAIVKGLRVLGGSAGELLVYPRPRTPRRGRCSSERASRSFGSCLASC